MEYRQMLKSLLNTTAIVLLLSGAAYAQTSTSPSGKSDSGATATSPGTVDRSAGPAGGASGSEMRAQTTTPAPATPGTTGATSGATGGDKAMPAGTSGTAVKASNIMGLNIQNPENETIGEIEDVLVSQDGKIEQVVVSVGGFLGIGAKNVAIDWKDLKLDPSKRVAQVSMSRDQLKSAPEFKSDRLDAMERAKATEPARAPIPPAGGPPAPAGGATPPARTQ